MGKIAVISTRVRLNNEKGHTRFRYICELLTEAGYEVDLITTTFQYWEKKQRNLTKIQKEKYKFNIKFIFEPGYKKNISFQRMHSHKIAAKNLTALLEKEGDYDLIYAEIPPNDVALAAAEYAKKKDIPFVVDVDALWPEAMYMAVNVPIVRTALFSPLQRDAEKVYSLASGVIGTSDEYRDRPFENQKREIPKQTVYAGNDLSIFDEGVQKSWEIVNKSEDEFWVTYAGTIGEGYDIRTMILAAEKLAERGLSDIRFKILGGGPMKAELEEMANVRQIYNVEFVGYTTYEKMAAYLKKSDILVNSYVKKASKSVVTKIGDYLAAGKPMINTCMSQEFQNKVETDGFGVNIMPEDVSILVDTIEDLYEDKELCLQMGRRARTIAEEQFDRPKSYQKIVEMIQQLLDKR